MPANRPIAAPSGMVAHMKPPAPEKAHRCHGRSCTQTLARAAQPTGNGSVKNAPPPRDKVVDEIECVHRPAAVGGDQRFPLLPGEFPDPCEHGASGLIALRAMRHA